MGRLLILIATLSALPTFAQDTWQVGGRGGLSWSEVAHLNVMGDEKSSGALQPTELRPDVNVLPLIGQNYPWDRWQFPLDPFRLDGMPRLWRGAGNSQSITHFQPVSTFVDGDRDTFVSKTNVGIGKPFSEYYTIAPGAPLPLERFEIHLPLEFDPVTGEANPDCCDRFGMPWSRYIPHQGELSGSTVETLEMLTEQENTHYQAPSYFPLTIPLGSVKGHLVAPLIIDFPLQYLSFVRWKTFADTGETDGAGNPLGMVHIWLHAIGYGELELYGRGFAGETRIITKVQDLGEPKTLGRVFMDVSKWQRVGSDWQETTDDEGNVQRRWQVGQLVEEPDAQVAVSWRIRNGLTDDPLTYYTWNDQIELLKIDRAEWDGLDDRGSQFLGYQGPVTEDRDNWTGWAGPVTEFGAHLDMPSRRYFQLEIKTTTAEPWQMARVDSLWIEFFPLLAPTLVGEVGVMGDSGANIAEVHIGEPSELVYAIRAEFDGEGREGFDVLRIDTPSEPEFLRLLQGENLQEVELDLDRDVLTDSLGLTIYLDEPVQSDEKFQVALRTVAYTVSTRLHGTVFNRNKGEIRQKVEEGNATDMIATNKLDVIASGDVVRDVIGRLAIQPPVFTPNGDGRNDDLQLEYTIYGVLDASVEIAIYTLAGKPVHSIEITDVAGGKHARTWNGRTATGALVDPGLYLAQVKAQTGRGSFEITRPFSVVY